MKYDTIGRIRNMMVVIGILGLALLPPAVAADVPLMTTDELKGMLGNPDVIILDVRSGRDWNASEFKIQDAVRANPGDYGQWAATYPKDKTLVLYCA